MTATRERQPGDRAPAPGPLALVQAFANSRWDLERGFVDRWAEPVGLWEWLVAFGLLEPDDPALGERDLERAVDVREGLRELMFHNNGAELNRARVQRMNAALRTATVSVTLGSGAPASLIPARAGLDGGLARIAGVVALAQLDGSWARMKACRGADCGWVFFDHSRNQSGSWCSMSVCGARQKARAYRARKRTRGVQ